jgi:hypothetical protein
MIKTEPSIIPNQILIGYLKVWQSRGQEASSRRIRKGSGKRYFDNRI